MLAVGYWRMEVGVDKYVVWCEDNFGYSRLCCKHICGKAGGGRIEGEGMHVVS